VKPYWDNFLDETEVRSLLAKGYDLYDCRNEDRNHDMRGTYPTFVDRDFKVFYDGSCWGWTSEDIASKFISTDSLSKSSFA
jgi:hypothetical protein